MAPAMPRSAESSDEDLCWSIATACGGVRVPTRATRAGCTATSRACRYRARRRALSDVWMNSSARGQAYRAGEFTTTFTPCAHLLSPTTASTAGHVARSTRMLPVLDDVLDQRAQRRKALVARQAADLLDLIGGCPPQRSLPHAHESG